MGVSESIFSEQLFETQSLVKDLLSLIIYYSKFAKDRYHINPIQKKFENMYLIIDLCSSDINSVFSIQLQNE